MRLFTILTAFAKVWQQQKAVQMERKIIIIRKLIQYLIWVVGH